MADLLLLRHGEASYQAATDRERSLTLRGESDAARVGQWLAEHARVRRILHSPYRRTTQTAQAVQCALSAPVPMQAVEWLMPDTDPRHWLTQLEGQDWSGTLLVTHQPLVGVLVQWLTEGSLHGQRWPSIQPATLSIVSGELLSPGCLSLKEMRQGADLQRLAP